MTQLNHDTVPQTLHTPPPEPSDSEGVLLALETARSLEEQGELLEAARWLRRAADDAAEDTNDERALVLARAAAHLLKAIESKGAPATASPSSPMAIAPAIAALVSPVTPSSSHSGSSPPPLSSPPSSPSVAPPLVSYVSELGAPPGEPRIDPTMRIGAIRVAIAGSTGDAKAFVVRRLEAGEQSPEGTVEALLVLMGEIEGFLELATRLQASGDSTKKS